MFIEQCLLSTSIIRSVGKSLAFNSKGPRKFVSLNNQPWQARPTLTDINSGETFFDPFTVSVSKCGGSCNIIDNPYARVCVLDKVKIMNLNVFNLMSGVNETKFLVLHKLHECKYD